MGDGSCWQLHRVMWEHEKTQNLQTLTIHWKEAVDCSGHIGSVNEALYCRPEDNKNLKILLLGVIHRFLEENLPFFLWCILGHTPFPMLSSSFTSIRSYNIKLKPICHNKTCLISQNHGYVLCFSWNHHRLGGSIKHRKMANFDPQGAETPEPISMKLGVVDYLCNPNYHAKFGGCRSMWGSGCIREISRTWNIQQQIIQNIAIWIQAVAASNTNKK